MKDLFSFEKFFEMKDLFWFLMGLIMPAAISKTYKLLTRKTMEKKVKKINSEYIDAGEVIMPIAHGLPFYSKKSLVFENPVETFYFEMPENIHQQLCCANPDFEHTMWEEDASYWESRDEDVLLNAVLKITTGIDRDELKELLEEKEVILFSSKWQPDGKEGEKSQ